MNEYIRQLINEEKARQEKAERAEAEQLAREKAEEQARSLAEWEKVRTAICATIPEDIWPCLVKPDAGQFPAHQTYLELRIEGLAPIEACAWRGKDGYEFKTFYVMRAGVKHSEDPPPSVRWVLDRMEHYDSLAEALVRAEQRYAAYQADVAAVAEEMTKAPQPAAPRKTLIESLLRRFIRFTPRGSYE